MSGGKGVSCTARSCAKTVAVLLIVRLHLTVPRHKSVQGGSSVAYDYPAGQNQMIDIQVLVGDLEG